MRQLSKYAIFCTLLALFFFILLELGARAVLAVVVGPDVLWFGTPYCCGPDNRKIIDAVGLIKDAQATAHTVSVHENSSAGYSKYFPNQKRLDYDQNYNAFEVTINKYGFRGEEFTIEKADDTIRVVTLGASSTFGYHNRDNETYPVYLENILNTSRCGKFEVINLGIPHLTSGQILALFEAEGMPLKPDVVTFYEGVNDAAAVVMYLRLWEDISILYKIIGRVKSHVFPLFRNWSIVFAFLDNVVDYDFEVYRFEDVGHILEERKKRFVGNLQSIKELAEGSGTIFIVSSQPAKSTRIPREKIRGVTYWEENELLKSGLSEGGRITLAELYFLIHGELMRAEAQWAKTHDVRFVDAISRMDDRRDHLLNWVHLTPEGNQIVAQSYSEKILEAVCSESQAEG